MKYDVVIVGAGPAGIFAALQLATAGNAKICIVDQGPDIDRRLCGTHMLTGWGGAGAFSDGKLTLSPDVGGQLSEVVSESEVRELLDTVDRVWIEYGASEQVYGADEDAVDAIARRAQLAGLRLVHSRIRHMGTDMCPAILTRMRDALRERADVRMETRIDQILVNSDRVTGVVTESGDSIEADYVIVAPGRAGSDWFSREAERLNLRMMTNPVDIGVRVEIPAVVIEDITDIVYEPKLVYYTRSFDDKVRSFCVCPNGEVVPETHNGVTTVNGHSYVRKKTANTNFALLVSTSFTEPFHEPITYGKYVASLANLLSGGVIVQRLGDLESGRRSTGVRIERGLTEPTLKDAVPGDLSFVLSYRHLSGVLEMLHALDRLSPGVASPHTLLYGVEVKFYSSRLELSNRLETAVRNLFAVGDGVGLTRGLMQASASGVVAAREILSRLSSGSPPAPPPGQ